MCKKLLVRIIIMGIFYSPICSYAIMVETSSPMEDTRLAAMTRLKEKSSPAVSIDSVKNEIKKPTFQIVLPSRPGDPKLKRNVWGVATIPQRAFKNMRVRGIPLLDIGSEPGLKSRDWVLPRIHTPTLTKFDLSARPTVDVATDAEIKTYTQPFSEAVSPAEVVKISGLSEEKFITSEKVAKVAFIVKSETQFTPLEVTTLDSEDLKALRAMILVEKSGRCAVVAGLLHDLSLSKKSEYRSYSNLELSLCLHKLGLHTESVHRLMELVGSEQKDYVLLALKHLVNKLPFEYEVLAAPTLSRVSALSLGDEKDRVNHLLAKAYSRMGEYERAESYGLRVSSKFKDYLQTQYLVSLAEYDQGKVKMSQERLRKLVLDLDARKDDSALAGFINLNFARISFQKKDFDQAVTSFNRIKKDNPLWIQALTEQGWAQLMNGDSSGAIGNMYSIHAPYFNVVYKPESYVVRTIGYLNICQYGDAYRTLTQMEHIYRPYLDQIERYLETTSSESRTYSSVVSYLRSSSQSSIDGVGALVWREVARHKNFLNIQTGINNRLDEEGLHSTLSTSLEKEKSNLQVKLKRTRERIEDLRSRLTKASRTPATLAQLPELKLKLAADSDLMNYLDFELSIVAESQDGFRRLSRISRPKVDSVILAQRKEAGKVVTSRLRQMREELIRMIENNELLRYEIFSGSGENIRFHMAGGKAGANRIPASAKPQGKNLQWEFDGEYWEDEIGHYRSSLKNNCPSRDKDNLKSGEEGA